MASARLLFRRFSATVLAGGVTGLVVGGLGGRLAMLVLRLTTGDAVHGVVSDDGFIIGQVTLGGTIGLCALGMAIGVLGGFVHRLVVPWLIGPRWFRRLTTAFGCGAVVGAMLVHRGGIDFTTLRPAGLAIALFVLIPALYGALIGPVQEACDRPDSWVNRHRVRRVAAPILTIAVIPFALPMVVFFFLLAWAWGALRDTATVSWAASQPATGVIARAPWVAVVAVGVVDLVRDSLALV
jgi:hypothetical protein